MSDPIERLPFDQLYTRYSAATLRRIHRYIHDDATAFDLRQEVFLKVWRNWSTFDCRRGSVFAWIIVITTSTCIDYLRKSSTKKPLARQMHDIGESSRPIGPDVFVARRELNRLARRLSGPQLEVLTMIYYKGLTQEEVSRLLNIPLGTVKTRQRTAIIALRKIYGA